MEEKAKNKKTRYKEVEGKNEEKCETADEAAWRKTGKMRDEKRRRIKAAEEQITKTRKRKERAKKGARE